MKMTNKIALGSRDLNITPITDMASFEKVVSEMNLAIESALVSIDGAKDGVFAIGFPPAGKDWIAQFDLVISNYRSTLKEVYSGSGSVRTGMKVWANKDD